jgi:hypothetical protein
MFISGNEDFKPQKSVRRNFLKDHYRLIQGKFHQEDEIIVNV